MLLGVDTGGTFTDFVWFNGERLKIHKVLSTPDAPEQAILQGIRELGLYGESYHLVHGSTVATNAVLEGKGVRTAYVTNYGLGDVLTIGGEERSDGALGAGEGPDRERGQLGEGLLLEGHARPRARGQRR